jgi:large subunit ribosomal protein L5
MAYEYVPLKDRFENEVVPTMTKEFGYKNRLEVPRVSKIVVNMGIGEGSRNADLSISMVRN